MFDFAGKRRKRSTGSSLSSTSRISRCEMEHILEKLKANQHRSSTKATYLAIWRHFNSFLVKLDHRPKAWEDRTTLFCAYLVDKGTKSTTIRSYISAIKHIVVTDKYKWDDERVMVNVISNACKLANDIVTIRFPIHIGLLETLIFELKRVYATTQPYLYIFIQMFISSCILWTNADRRADR